MRVATVVLIVVATAALTACSKPGEQKTYSSPDAAVEALVKAAGSEDKNELLAVLGKAAEPLIDSGDPVQDKHARDKFLQEYKESHSFDDSVEGKKTLVIGADKWPFPFPLVQENGKWSFDGAEGAEVIVDRRVGENELATIQVCLAFVDAE